MPKTFDYNKYACTVRQPDTRRHTRYNNSRNYYDIKNNNRKNENDRSFFKLWKYHNTKGHWTSECRAYKSINNIDTEDLTNGQNNEEERINNNENNIYIIF
ncbi:hypothetical protein BDAP_000591 [Binucleata daphniae]